MLEVLKNKHENTTEEGHLGRDEAKPAVVPPHPVVRACVCCAGLWRLWPGTSSSALITPQSLLMLFPIPGMPSFPRLVRGLLLLRSLPEAFRMPVSELPHAMSIGPPSVGQWWPTPVALGRGCHWAPHEASFY